MVKIKIEKVNIKKRTKNSRGMENELLVIKKIKIHEIDILKKNPFQEKILSIKFFQTLADWPSSPLLYTKDQTITAITN